MPSSVPSLREDAEHVLAAIDDLAQYKELIDLARVVFIVNDETTIIKSNRYTVSMLGEVVGMKVTHWFCTLMTGRQL